MNWLTVASYCQHILLRLVVFLTFEGGKVIANSPVQIFCDQARQAYGMQHVSLARMALGEFNPSHIYNRFIRLPKFS